jgi:UDP-hydrolysing UDP-N-acetyl-D-glucosamine 2-epimerase
MISTRTRRIAVITTGRQDYGILRSTLQHARNHPSLELEIWAGGMHFGERFGDPVKHIRADGFAIARELPFLSELPDTVKDSATAMHMIGAAMADDRPDGIVLVGDRTETLAAAFAAAVNGIPVIHFHGGEESEGAVDNALRHAITKLSHLHLVSHAEHARRVLQMGEAPHSVEIVGPPGCDNLYRDDLPDRAALERDLSFSLEDAVVLVTVHPTTTLGTGGEPEAIAEVIRDFPARFVITQPNSDSGNQHVRDVWAQMAELPNVRVVEALGAQRYWALLKIVGAVLGNSSSGIIEAPAANVPVVNVGDRQKGRLRVGAVRDVVPEASAIRSALTDALNGMLESATAAYPAGAAAPRVVRAIESFDFDAGARKRFEDLECKTPS